MKYSDDKVLIVYDALIYHSESRSVNDETKQIIRKVMKAFNFNEINKIEEWEDVVELRWSGYSSYIVDVLRAYQQEFIKEFSEDIKTTINCMISELEDTIENFPDDQLANLALHALRYYFENEELNYETEEIIQNMFDSFSFSTSWSDILEMENPQIIIDAFKAYKQHYKSKLSIGIRGTINSCINHLQESVKETTQDASGANPLKETTQDASGANPLEQLTQDASGANPLEQPTQEPNLEEEEEWIDVLYNNCYK